MTNIAFTTLLVLLFAVPGFVVRASYWSGDKQVLPTNWTDDIAKGFLYAVPFHLVGILIVDGILIHRGWLSTHTNFYHLFQLISGSYEKGAEPIVYALYEDRGLLLVYSVLVVGVAFLVGYKLRGYVWEHKLDLRYPRIFGFGNAWLYELVRPRLLLNFSELYVFAEALTRIPISEGSTKTRLYRGIVYTFSVDETGGLRDIFLTETQRGEMDNDGQFRWKPIVPSSKFVLKYSEVVNLNISYLTPRSAGTAPAGHSAKKGSSR